MRVLVSVRNVDEALVAAQGGADFIDLKEPNHGALGALSLETIRAVLAALREHGVALPVSATIGDAAPHEQGLDIDGIVGAVQAVGGCGVSYVKVGMPAPGPVAVALLHALACVPTPVIPVFLADHGLVDKAVLHGSLQLACRLGFPAIMVDTFDKHRGSVFDMLPEPDLRHFVQQAQQAGLMAGVAGALQLAHLPMLKALAPDFAGFRTAVCAHGRQSSLDAERLHNLKALLQD